MKLCSLLILVCTGAMLCFAQVKNEVVFVRSVAGIKQICTINTDATDFKTLTSFSSDPSTLSRPSYSPDGKMIAFWLNQGSGINVWLMNADGSGMRQVTSNNEAYVGDRITFSPGLDVLYYRRTLGPGEASIWRIGTDGQNNEFFCDFPGNEYSILFVDDSYLLYHVNFGGVYRTESLFDLASSLLIANAEMPALNNSLTKICYRDNPSKIRIADLNGTPQVLLADEGNGTVADPSFTSDDQYVVYHLSEQMIKIVKTDGTDLHVLTTGWNPMANPKLKVIGVPPTISCPDLIVMNADPGKCAAQFDVSEPGIATTGTPTPTISYSVGIPHAFAVGTTIVTATATNIAGSASCTFTVTVIDDQPPVISNCPDNIEIGPQTLAGAVVSYPEPTASDNCPGVTIGLVDQRWGSGALFPIGTTTVEYLARDASGNTTPCSFTVTVLDPACASNKVNVCHKGKTICVSVSAIEAHLAHGDFLGQCGTGKVFVDIPTDFTLSEAYPNPFNPTTTIEFGIPNDSYVRLEVFNMLGERVATLVNETRTAGYYAEQFNAANLASGLYVYRFSVTPSAGQDLVPTGGRDGQAGDYVQTKKLMLVR